MDVSRCSIGMNVWLKSGGPPLTVLSIVNESTSPPLIMCLWLSGNSIGAGTFHPDTLVDELP